MNSSQGETINAMAATISDYLRSRSGVSLVELSRDVDGFEGAETWGYDETNLIFWTRMSRVAVAAMTQLLAEEKIIATPSSILVYAFDGGVLDMPIARDLRRKYARPRWMPLVFAGTRGTA